MHRRIAVALPLLAAAALACGHDAKPTTTTTQAGNGDVSADRAPAAASGGSAGSTAPGVSEGPVAAAPGSRVPNELGRIPVLEYHLLGGGESRWKVDTAHFRQTLEMLYADGYRPVNVADILDRKLDLPAGQSPVTLVFDDASPEQFRYVERNGQLEVDPNSAVGILLAFNRKHPDWSRKAVFCMLPAANAGHAFFGDKGIQGQKSEWRFRKVQFLHEQGFELCNHTLYHAILGKQTDERAQEFIARGEMAIDSAVPGYRTRTFALPLGVWPKNKALAWQGAWRDPKSGRTVSYRYESVLEVAGGPTRSPYDPEFDPHHMMRVEAFGQNVERTIAQLDRSGNRYVSDGDPKHVAHPVRPTPAVASR